MNITKLTREVEVNINKINYIRDNIQEVVTKNFSTHYGRINFIKQLVKLDVRHLEVILESLKETKKINKRAVLILRKLNQLLSKVNNMNLVKEIFNCYKIKLNYLVELITNFFIYKTHDNIKPAHKLQPVYCEWNE